MSLNRAIAARACMRACISCASSCAAAVKLGVRVSARHSFEKNATLFRAEDHVVAEEPRAFTYVVAPRTKGIILRIGLVT